MDIRERSTAQKLMIAILSSVLLTACDSRPYDRAAVAKAQGTTSEYSPPPSPPPSNYVLASRVGNAMKEMKFIDRFEIHGTNLDLYLSSMLPGDARDMANAACMSAKQQRVPSGWTVRAFLVVGDRPAATCRIE
jgi:hypothetical protein